jgi:hypothetical protein
MNRLDDMTFQGEVVIVQRPHQMPCRLYSFASVDEAFNAFSQDAIFTSWDSFSKFQENFAGDDDFINEVKEQLENSGIALDQPFAEWALYCNHDTEFLPMPVGKLSLLKELADYDMHQGQVFVADGESYRDFIDEIYDNTRGHNEPLRVQIRKALWVEEDEEEAE